MKERMGLLLLAVLKVLQYLKFITTIEYHRFYVTYLKRESEWRTKISIFPTSID